MPPQRTTKGSEDSKTYKRVGRKKGARQVIHMENGGGPNQANRQFSGHKWAHMRAHISHTTHAHPQVHYDP